MTGCFFRHHSPFLCLCFSRFHNFTLNHVKGSHEMIKMTSFEPRAMIARCVLSSGNADTLEYIVERGRMGKRTGHVGKDRERGLLHTTYNDTLLILKCGELFVRSCARVSLACPKYGDNKNKNTRTRSKHKEIVFPSHHFNRHKTFDFIRFFCVERRDIPYTNSCPFSWPTSYLRFRIKGLSRVMVYFFRTPM